MKFNWFKKNKPEDPKKGVHTLHDSTFESPIEIEENINKSLFKKIMDWTYKNIYKKLASFRQVLIWYILITLVAALLLWSPLAQIDSKTNPVDFMDAFFIAASAFSDTGLVTVGVSDSFNGFGQSIIFVLIQLGGIGWFAIKVFVITLILKKVRFSIVEEASEEMGTNTKKLTIDVVKVAVISTISITLFAGIIFGIVFATVPEVNATNATSANLINNWGQSIWTGIFHAGASVNNAGFDIFAGNTSMAAYYGNVGIQVFTLLLFIFGGIGFTVIYDVKQYIKHRYSNKKFKFSLLTKISSLSYLIVALVGLSATYATEYSIQDSFIHSNEASGNATLDWWAITFNTFSTRNAGFSTFNIESMSTATKGTWSLMMFIGSGPGSTAGGLRTTTVAIIFLTIYSRVRNREHVTAFNRTIPSYQVRDALMIFVFSFMLVITSTIFIVAIEGASTSSINFVDYFFLTNSAYGTTGLATLNLATLNNSSKFIIIIIMFIGQLGIITTLRNFKLHSTKKEKVLVEYLTEEINLGH